MGEGFVLVFYFVSRYVSYLHTHAPRNYFPFSPRKVEIHTHTQRTCRLGKEAPTTSFKCLYETRSSGCCPPYVSFHPSKAHNAVALRTALSSDDPGSLQRLLPTVRSSTSFLRGGREGRRGRNDQHRLRKSTWDRIENKLSIIPT